MSELSFYLERARNAHAMRASMEMAADQAPTDQGLHLNVAAAELFADRADNDLYSFLISVSERLRSESHQDTAPITP